jgi:hypothetical protein
MKGMEWIQLAQDRSRLWALVNNRDEPSGSSATYLAS